MNYKELIRLKREEAHLSQRQLAKLVGIQQPSMNQIESGQKNPSLKVLFAICQTLGITEIPVPPKSDT